MLHGKLLAGILMIAVISGCAKKKVQNDSEFSEITKKAVQQQASTADIFEEFYKDDSSNADSQPAKETRSSEIGKNKSSEQTSYSFSENGRYVIQISTLASRGVADRLVEKLDAKGYPAYVAEVQNPTPQLYGTYYRVRIGRFSQISTAKAFGNDELKPLGYDFWVDNKSNDNIGIQGEGFGESSPASNFTPSNYQTYPTYPATANTPSTSYSNAPNTIPEQAPSQAVPPAEQLSVPVEPVTPNPAPTPSSAAPLDEEW